MTAIISKLQTHGINQADMLESQALHSGHGQGQAAGEKSITNQETNLLSASCWITGWGQLSSENVGL